MLWKLILTKLTKYTEGEYGLSEMHFGFREDGSTADANRTVVENEQS